MEREGTVKVVQPPARVSQPWSNTTSGRRLLRLANTLTREENEMMHSKPFRWSICNLSTFGITRTCYMRRQVRIIHYGGIRGKLKPPLWNGWLTWLSLRSVLCQLRNVGRVTCTGYVPLARSGRFHEYHPWICPCMPVLAVKTNSRTCKRSWMVTFVTL